jgi:hypothetical protein
MQAREMPDYLSSNGVLIPFDTDLFEPMQALENWRNDPAEARERLRTDGHVLLRGALDRETVLALREAYFARFDASFFAAGTTPREGVFSGTVPDELPDYGTVGHPAYDFVRSPEFDRFTREDALALIAATVLDGPAELLPRRILRHFHRGAARASRAHVDFDYMDHGSDRVVTAWIPVGDCPVECGGLVYLSGSHEIPRERLDALRTHTDRPQDKRPISNDLGLTARELGGRWMWADYRAGDVALHSPHTVHASLDDSSDVMRLSVDLRFVRRDAEADERWSEDWSADDGF